MKRTLLFVLGLIAFWSGPPDGPYELYHDNGQLWRKSTHVDGELDGPAEALPRERSVAGERHLQHGCGVW